MTLGNAVIFILFASFAVSYGWGMRGSAIGGEKGAMLPGAFLGTLCAFFSGNEVVIHNFWIFSAVGAFAMYFGGTEPYAQTMDFVLKGNKENKTSKKGYIGLSIKGALWFGIAASFIGIAFSAIAGKYSLTDIIILIVLIPVVRLVGTMLFNYPQNPKLGIFPRFYFSKGSHEEWGALTGVIIELIVFTAIKSDFFSLSLCLGGIVSGAVGWIIGITLMKVTSYPKKNGKYIFGKYQIRDQIDNWKIMEFTLGAVGAFGISLSYVLSFGYLQKTLAVLSSNGIAKTWISSNEKVIVIIWLVLLAADVLKNIIPERNTKFSRIYQSLAEKSERPLYCYTALFLCLSSSVLAAQIASYVLMLWVIIEKIVFEQMKKSKGGFLLKPIGFALAAFCAVYIMLYSGIGLIPTWIMYCTVYVILDFLWNFRLQKSMVNKIKRAKSFSKWFVSVGSVAVVSAYFFFDCSILIILGIILFK